MDIKIDIHDYLDESEIKSIVEEKSEELTAVVLQEEYQKGYIAGQKKAYDECDEIARELSQIKSGRSKWLDEHNKQLIKKTLNKLWINAISMHDEYIDLEELSNYIDEIMAEIE